MNHGTLHTPVVILNLFFFLSLCFQLQQRGSIPSEVYYLYYCYFSIYTTASKSWYNDTNNHLSFPPLPACETYTLSFLFCRFSQIKFSLMCQLATRFPPGVKKRLEKHRGCCPTAALITQQETTAECRKWSWMHSLQEIECMPSRYSQGCNLWNILCHCMKKKLNYQVFCLICYKGE